MPLLQVQPVRKQIHRRIVAMHIKEIYDQLVGDSVFGHNPMGKWAIRPSGKLFTHSATLMLNEVSILAFEIGTLTGEGAQKNQSVARW